MRYNRDGWSIESGLVKGRPPPDWYFEEPEIEPFDFWYLEAFWDLDTTRPIGQVVGPIPWTAVQLWASVHDLDVSTSMVLTKVIRQLDNVYLKWIQKETPKSNG